MLHDFLNGDRMRETSDAALAQLAAQFFHSRHGHAINLVSIIAAEQQRRVVIGMAMSQRTANKALCWSMWGTFAAIIAAFASVVALIK